MATRLQNKCTRLMSILAIITFVVCQAIMGQSQNTQSQDTQKPATEVQQLKDRLLLLEETVKELKGQISSMEEASKNPTPKIVNADYSPTTPAGPATSPPETAAGAKTSGRKR